MHLCSGWLVVIMQDRGEGRDQWSMGTGFGGGGQGSTARFHASYLARAFGRVGVWELAHAACDVLSNLGQGVNWT